MTTTIIGKKRFRSEKAAPYFFISPFYIIFTIFFLIPTIASFILAFASGAPMWGVVKGLLREVESGELKEIVPEKK